MKMVLTKSLVFAICALSFSTAVFLPPQPQGKNFKRKPKYMGGWGQKNFALNYLSK